MNNKYQNILMVYPKFPPTYWGSQYYLPLIGKKAAMPPLGLITIAAMTPDHYTIKVVDLNCEPLSEETLEWADMVCFSAMLTQKSSLLEAAQRCRAAGKLVLIGGPYPTACPEECSPYCDVLILNEGEFTWRSFLKDIAEGSYEAIYTTEEKPDVTQTPAPRFELLNIDDYAIIPIQFSRGCPFLCDFCDIIVMFGRRPRTKTPEQVLRELDAVRDTGFRGTVFIVDDNFIGNKKEAKKLLGAITDWNTERGYPFFYGTEVTANVAEDPELLEALPKANFIWVFMGIETPSVEGLKESRKIQNIKGSLADRIKVVEEAGLLIYGSFIIGFDSDTEEIFQSQIDFITEAAIPNASIGPLMALPGTPLFKRMKKTGRLIEEATGDEERTIASGYSNIVTRIPRKRLLEGHLEILTTIYTPKAYFERATELLCRLPHPASLTGRIKKFLLLNFSGVRNIASKISTRQTSMRSMRGRLGTQLKHYREIPSVYRKASLRFAWDVIKRCPDQFPFVIHYITLGYHYYRFTFDHVVPGLTESIRNDVIIREQENAALEERPAA